MSYDYLLVHQSIAEERLQVWDKSQWRDPERVGTCGIGTDRQQVAGALVARVELLELARKLTMLRRDKIIHHSRDGLFNVDGGVMAGISKLAIKDDVTVENRTSGVSDGILRVIALGEYSVKSRD